MLRLAFDFIITWRETRTRPNAYRFLCFHPRNTNYVILLNHCEEPERFFIQNLIDRFYTNYTSRDIITYRRDYAIKKLKEFEQALSELGDKDEL